MVSGNKIILDYLFGDLPDGYQHTTIVIYVNAGTIVRRFLNRTVEILVDKSYVNIGNGKLELYETYCKLAVIG